MIQKFGSKINRDNEHLWNRQTCGMHINNNIIVVGDFVRHDFSKHRKNSSELWQSRGRFCNETNEGK